MKIWCVEDDASIRDIERYALEQSGYETRGFSEGTALWEALKEETPALILLDVMLPGEDGVELLRRLRVSPDTHRIPVIMATAKGAEFDKVQSLDLGADDYLVKPFGMMEMVSRVKAVLRRIREYGGGNLLQAGDLVMNIDEHTVTVGRERIVLTHKEYELLKLFLSNPGTAFTREQLFQEVWGAEYVGESRTVDMHIRTLRQKIGTYGKRIQTLRGYGYRMEAQA